VLKGKPADDGDNAEIEALYVTGLRHTVALANSVNAGKILPQAISSFAPKIRSTLIMTFRSLVAPPVSS